MKRFIDENTGFSLAVVAILIAGAVYIASVSFQGNANAKAIDDHEEKLRAIGAIQTDLGIMKSQLNRIEKKLSDE